MTNIQRSDVKRYDLAGFVTDLWNPEDLVELPGTPWIIVSGMRSERHPGRVFKVDRNNPAGASELGLMGASVLPWLDPGVFNPHGIATRRLGADTFELLVVDHGGGEAIDRLIVKMADGTPFIVDGEKLMQPPGTSANAVAHLPDGGFVMTSMFDPGDCETPSRFAKGQQTGQVWRWSPWQSWSRFGDVQMSAANGIAASEDGCTIIVCEWAARRIWRLDGQGRPLAKVETNFLPDNLRWTDDGHLLLAGQSDRPEAVFGCVARGDRCPLAFRVVRLDPESLAMTDLIACDEATAVSQGFGGATGALAVDDKIWVGSFTGTQIGVFGL